MESLYKDGDRHHVSIFKRSDGMISVIVDETFGLRSFISFHSLVSKSLSSFLRLTVHTNIVQDLILKFEIINALQDAYS